MYEHMRFCHLAGFKYQQMKEYLISKGIPASDISVRQNFRNYMDNKFGHNRPLKAIV